MIDDSVGGQIAGGQCKENIVTDRNRNEKAFAALAADPRSGSSLVPMLVGGLVLIVIGMIGALAFA